MYKKFIKILFPYLPETLKKKVFEISKKSKLSAHKERKQRVKISLSEVEEVLNNLNLSCDTIIHASTSNIGKIEGGTVNLTNLIVSKVNTEKYTLLAPALPFLGSTKDYLISLNYFDLSLAKNAMGNISNQIMKNNESFRSFHPTHSVVALGLNADNYTNTHHLEATPFGEGSPYSKLTWNKGKILMFGVDLNSVTNFHVYEDMILKEIPFKVYSDETFKIKSINKGNESYITTPVHNQFLSAKRDCELARKDLIKNGYIKSYKLGDSEVSLLDAKGLTITLLQMLLDGRTIYGKVKLSKSQELYIKEKASKLLL